jgi:hypothetical protein
MRRAARLAVLCAVLLLPAGFVAGCGGSGSDSSTGSSSTDPSAYVGPIPAAEFASVPPPTYSQVIAAFRTVTTANPALLANEAALARALFDEVRRMTLSDAAAGRAWALGAARRQALVDLDAHLTPEEWKLVIRSPLSSARAATTIEVSADAAVQMLPCEASIGFFDGKADALRHAYWNALMTRRTSAAFAELFASAHEAGSSNTPAASAMDLHNNAVGRGLAVRYPSASDAELLVLLAQQSFLFVPAGTPIPAPWTGLVHIAEGSRQPFDGIFSGTLTPPDTSAAGSGPWNVQLALAQCGATVRGHWRASGNGLAVERRFEGQVTGSATLTLVVADPLPFETDAGPGPCLSLQVVLAGSEQALAGTWTSASCPQGGQMSVAR